MACGSYLPTRGLNLGPGSESAKFEPLPLPEGIPVMCIIIASKHFGRQNIGYIMKASLMCAS